MQAHHLRATLLFHLRQIMLSPKAEAFSIENILGIRDGKDAEHVNNMVRNVCLQSVGTGGMQCIHPSRLTVYDSTKSKSIGVELCQSDLWHSFHNLGTEMIITKTGRRMFPAVRIRLHGLDPNKQYNVHLDFMQLDNKKYRYVYHNSKWMVSGSGEQMVPSQSQLHPDCPMKGSFLTTQVISFERIKLTNSEKARHGQVSLLSMQKFVPRVYIQSVPSDSCEDTEQYVVYFPQTSFIAVTAYQNQEITRLKIARNPFAKGFREAGKNRSSLEAMIESYGIHVDLTNPYNIQSTGLSRRSLKRPTSMTGDEDLNSKGDKMRHLDLSSYSFLQLPRPFLDSPPSPSFCSTLSGSPPLGFPCYIKTEIPEIISTDADHRSYFNELSTFTSHEDRKAIVPSYISRQMQSLR